MNPKGTNRSVLKTKERLRHGLTELLSEKPAKRISVREITERININRGTFYLYYKDIYDMIEQLENEVLEEYKEIVLSHAPKVPGEIPKPILFDLYSFVADNADMCLALLGPHGDLSFTNKMKELVRERLLYYWNLFYKDQYGDSFEYFYSFLISGCFGLFEAWLKTGMRETPREMAALTEKMFIAIAKELEQIPQRA